MNRKQKNWTLFFGIVTALVVVLSQIFWFQASGFSKKIADTEQKAGAKKSGNEEAHISLPSSSLPSTGTVVVGHDFSFIHDILFETKSTCKSCKTVVAATGKFFQTLFSVIIAPNAP
jgi:hypothetical protein